MPNPEPSPGRAVHRPARGVAADAAIVPHVRPLDSLDGLRLTRFDKPLIHNRKLLDSIYFGLARPRPAAVADLP